MKLQKSGWASVFVLIVVWMLISHPGWTGAAEAPAAEAESAPLQVVTYASGLTGFFDPSAKRLYLYGADVRTPFMVVEVDKLGQPLKLIQRTAQ